MQSNTPGDGGGGVGIGRCATASPVVILVLTVLATLCATGMLCTAIMTDDWEQLDWDYQKLVQIVGPHTPVVKHDKAIQLELPGLDNWSLRKNHSVLLVPMLGGIWNLCIDLTEREMRDLRPFKNLKMAPCINYLANEGQRKEETFPGSNNDYLGPHLRMQNLAISCALVCLIILGAASLLGAFGVCQKQNSAILITGVMYLLAALFALFTSMIMLFKRQNGGGTGTDYDGTLAKELSYIRPVLFQARIVRASWSLDLGWCGVILCTTTSLLWLYLSKLLRYTPSAFVM